MKIYYYAHTGHKNGLDRLKKATALLKKLNEKGLDTLLLVNDFRASLVAREFGIADSVHIETVQDIDAIAEMGDVVIMDTPENDRGRLEKYCREFKHVFRFAQDEADESRYGETMLSETIIDDLYFEEHKKEDRTLFFLSDSDADKTILSNRNFFEDKGMDLLLGHYFYVKYESDLAKIFNNLHESEEYIELICSSSHVVTASFQTALEARVAGAEVIYISLGELNKQDKLQLESYKIKIIDGFDSDNYNEILSKGDSKVTIINKTDKTVQRIINKL